MATTDVLLYGDTERHAALRHELPIVIIDPFLLGVIDGRTHIMAGTWSATGSRPPRPARCCTTCATSATGS